MKRLFVKIFSLTLLTIYGCSSTQEMLAPDGKRQSDHKFEASIKVNVGINYLLYLPKDYDQKDKIPLMLFLHGAGERGADLELVKKHGPPKLIDEGKDLPFIVVSPQCSANSWWPTETFTLLALIDDLCKNYKVDEDKIYVTGLSMGGYGTWSLAIQNPDRFAAVLPICGGGDLHSICKIGNLPVWAFHGEKDVVVPVKESKELVDKLKICGGNVELTVYPEANHDSWTETYNNSKIYDWLLSHSKSERNGN